MIGTWLWLPALKAGKDLATTGVAWSVMSAFVTVGLGVLFFKERLTAVNYVGLVMAVIALVLLQIKG
jgi:multidrug transporter EmrE-like cation transporter